MLLFLFSLTLLSGCARLTGNYEPPTVGLKSFRLLPSTGIVPQFAIRLHLVNPNRNRLELEGMYYIVKIDGHKVLSGVSNQLPAIEAYSEGDITINATVDLMGSARLVQSLIRKNDGVLTYLFEGKLDTGVFTPPIRVSEKGTFSPEL